jgi:hypothetical protein
MAASLEKTIFVCVLFSAGSRGKIHKKLDFLVKSLYKGGRKFGTFIELHSRFFI